MQSERFVVDFFDQEGKPVYQDLQERTVCYQIGGIETNPKQQFLWHMEIRKAEAILSVIESWLY